MFCRRAAVHNARRFTVFIKKGCVLMVDLRENEVKDAGFEKIDFLAREAFELNYFLAENPELSGKEYLACEKICALLESHGITVERAFAGIPTAFRGTVCEAPDSGINIGIIAEYDALPEIGHACGHCASGSLSLLAALALHECADLVPANIDIIGTPDEEATGKKIEMAEAGLFDKYDFVIMIHMDSKNKAEMKLLALSAFHYNFRGQPAHASACPWAGKNALNGAMLMIHGFDMMRQHLKPTTRVHGIIIRGGELFRKQNSARALLIVDRDGSFRVLTDRSEKQGLVANRLMEEGVWHTFEFGPVLVENGEDSFTAVSVTAADGAVKIETL